MFPMWLGCIAFAPMVILYHTSLLAYNDIYLQKLSFTNRVLGDFQNPNARFVWAISDRAS